MTNDNGKIKTLLYNHRNKNFTIKKHMKIAQIIPSPYLNTNTLTLYTKSQKVHGRCKNAFGSTGLF